MKYSGPIIDFHTHMQPDMVLADRDSYLAAEPDFSILYADPTSRIAGTGEVLASMERNGITAAVLLGFAWRNGDTRRLHNEAILDAVKGNPERFYAFPCVYPHDKNTAAEARYCLERGASGIGEIGLYDRDLDTEYIEAMRPAMKVCLEYDRPVMMHVNEPVGHQYDGKAPMSIRGIYNFLKEYPDNRIVLAHWGGGIFFFNTLKREAEAVLRNVWYDSAATPYLYKPSVWRLAADIVGIDRILFGTDFPLLEADRFFEELEQMNFSTGELEQILYRNALDLLG